MDFQSVLDFGCSLRLMSAEEHGLERHTTSIPTDFDYPSSKQFQSVPHFGCWRSIVAEEHGLGAHATSFAQRRRRAGFDSIDEQELVRAEQCE